MDFLMNIEWLTVLKIIGIDIMLGGDNALVIAMACASLSPEVRNRAILFGTGGAVLARVFFLAIASFVLGFQYVKLLAGAFLFYVAVKMLVDSEEDGDGVPQKTSIWGAVLTIVLADIGMSIDNVIAVSAASQSAGEHALYYMIAGIALSIPIIVYGSKLIMAIMDKFPIVVWLGAMLLGWVGMEMILTEPELKNHFTFLEGYGTIIKTVGFLSVAVLAKLTLKLRGE
jgi:YjbE family integral membrane protein